MSQRQTEKEITVLRDDEAVEVVIKSFWERARTAATLIVQLREEKAALSVRMNEINQDVQSLRADLSTKDQDLKKLRAEHAHLLNSNGHEILSSEEREILKSRIKDLIAKINSHL